MSIEDSQLSSLVADEQIERLDRSASLFAAHHATNLSTKVLKIYTQMDGALVIVPLAVIVAVVETIRQRSVSGVVFLTVATECTLVSPLMPHSSRSCSARQVSDLPFACHRQPLSETQSDARLHASPGLQLNPGSPNGRDS